MTVPDPAEAMCCSWPFEAFLAWYCFVDNSVKYELSNSRGFSVQGPSKPLR
eukprot:CAMPEP_0172588218 /NCGR_PEP_ID=MMETSP1068-20121228/7151_1 /TAXON_ID=35684 /ORGANISM="Pseudopedinella elastica, Strain CCMP716" /LENGTH=50 /DNA_ID=CAMNT_0013383485 /DNA_START=83 /DNA_END=232 /DNA_ORIENTATION=-